MTGSAIKAREPGRAAGRSWSDWFREGLDGKRADRLLRELRSLEPLGPVHVRWRERPMVLFSTNDYLGLSGHAEVRAAAEDAARRWGMGPRGSALVCGYTEEHEALEAELARLKDADAALLFPTGYAANTSVLAALAGNPDTAIFSDALNHASIIDGCRMASRSGAGLHVYRHGDVEHLGELLGSSRAPRKLVVTDTLFSMDGDLAPLEEIVALKERHGFLLMVDEAHATLVLGDEGGGLAEALALADEVDVHVGTLSKAFGCQGGFVACSREIRSWLLNEGRPFVFSTALPLPVVAAARAALSVRRRDPGLVRALDRRVARLRSATGIEGSTPIVPVLLGDAETALAAFDRLLEDGLFVPAIRPPTVPSGTSRLRVTLSAAHEEEDVDRLVAALRASGALA